MSKKVYTITVSQDIHRDVKQAVAARGEKIQAFAERALLREIGQHELEQRLSSRRERGLDE